MLYDVMQFQIYKMDPETHWKLVILGTLYIWLSAELLNDAHGNLPLGIPSFFCKSCPLRVKFSGAFTDCRYFPDKFIFLKAVILPVDLPINYACRIPYGLTWVQRH